MYDITCQGCGCEFAAIEVLPLRCRCGAVCWGDGVAAKPVPPKPTVEPPKPQPAERHKPCVHRGPIIGKADCDCANKPSVYSCDLHGICLPRMSVTAAAAMLNDGSRAIVSRSCRSCGDYRRT